MTELELLGPRASGEALGTAVLKAVAEDFQVDEVLDIPLSGQGEHLWLWVEKRDLNTEEAARRLARAAGVPVRAISYAGLKDRQALTRQWFSLHLPGKADPDLSRAEDDTLRVLKQVRHQRKLQRGAHSANGFTLRLTALQADRPALDARLEQLKQQGVPNYFGSQRFGHAGGNVHDAQDWAARQALPEQRNVRSRLLSAGRSYLFNQVLAARVADGTWQRAQVGDLLAFTDSRSFFPAGRPSAVTRAWPFSTCTPPARCGAKGNRLVPARPRCSRAKSPRVILRCANGWRERAWITNGASCGSLLGVCRGIIPSLISCNWNSSFRPDASPPWWCANSSIWCRQGRRTAHAYSDFE